jgi:hypothetical protein
MRKPRVRLEVAAPRIVMVDRVEEPEQPLLNQVVERHPKIAVP